MGEYPPLRPVPNWDGSAEVLICDTCGIRGVEKGHQPGGDVCRYLSTERFQKHSPSGDE